MSLCNGVNMAREDDSEWGMGAGSKTGKEGRASAGAGYQVSGAAARNALERGLRRGLGGTGSWLKQGLSSENLANSVFQLKKKRMKIWLGKWGGSNQQKKRRQL